MNIDNRITPENITQLGTTEYFVFASNDRGVNGKGAAKQALQWGAKNGVSFGFSGQTFAIITRKFINSDGKVHRINTLPIPEIKNHVDKFIEIAKQHPEKIFLVTAIGCGLAGYKPEDIAPLFKEAVSLENLHLPGSFWKILVP